MAAALAPITLNIAPGLAAGFPRPLPPSNPPTAADVHEAVKLKSLLSRELTTGAVFTDSDVDSIVRYEVDVISSRQLAQAAAAAATAAAPAAPATPLASMALILNAITGLRNEVAGLRTEVAGLTTEVAGLTTEVDMMNTNLQEMYRNIAKNANTTRGPGHHMPLDEVPFIDQSVPSVVVPAQPGQVARAALPALHNADDIRALTDA